MRAFLGSSLCIHRRRERTRKRILAFFWYSPNEASTLQNHPLIASSIASCVCDRRARRALRFASWHNLEICYYYRTF